MVIREAKMEDIQQMQIIRNAVKENVLSDPGLVKDKDYEEYMGLRGKGWVCEIKSLVVGFAIVDLQDNNIWALFVDPEHERMGIGLSLHNTMLDWYFSQTNTTVWLGTAFNTRAETFYRKAGWTEVGMHGSKEIKFEMKYEEWNRIRHIG